MSILQALDFIEGLRLSIVEAKISNLVLKEIKIDFLFKRSRA